MGLSKIKLMKLLDWIRRFCMSRWGESERLLLAGQVFAFLGLAGYPLYDRIISWKVCADILGLSKISIFHETFLLYNLDR